MRHGGTETVSGLVSQENPHGYWCRRCGRSREHAERWCSSADCKDRRTEEDRVKERESLGIYTWPLWRAR